MPISGEAVRSNYERIRGELGPEVTIVAATKYVDVEELGALAGSGIQVVGENRTIGSSGSMTFTDKFTPYQLHIYKTL